jgi:hypothetical protein
MLYIPCHVSHDKKICDAILSHATSHIPSVIQSPSCNLHHYQHYIYPMTYLPCHIISIMPYYYTMPYIMPYPLWLINNYQHAIYPIPCISCQTIYGMPYYPIPHLKCCLSCHPSYHLPHCISTITNLLYLTCHISHGMSCHICHVIFSHVISHVPYLCDTSMVPYVPALFSRYCLSCALSCAIHHVIHLWCHIYGSIYACIASKLLYNMVYLHLCCHVSSAICEGTVSKIFQTCSISCAIYNVSSLL